jgi:hypothetical protein
MDEITRKQFNTLEDLSVYYNELLFKDVLPYCLVNLSRNRKAVAFFIKGIWKALDGDIKYEISINPDTLGIGAEYWHSTLVHEMVHICGNANLGNLRATTTITRNEPKK